MTDDCLLPSILITGAAGFIGSHFVDHLLGQAARVGKIVALDNFNDNYDPALKRRNVRGSMTIRRSNWSNTTFATKPSLVGSSLIIYSPTSYISAPTQGYEPVLATRSVTYATTSRERRCCWRRPRLVPVNDFNNLSSSHRRPFTDSKPKSHSAKLRNQDLPPVPMA